MSFVRPRIIPVLLLTDGGLYKTSRFKEPIYVGDPINTVKIFNEKEVDEIVILDIKATADKRCPNYERISEIASEAFIPLAYGGGIRTVDQAKRILALGVEKVVINSAAIERPEFISELAQAIGSQSVMVSVDVKKNMFGKYHVFSKSDEFLKGISYIQWVRKACDLGAGEILIQSVDRDGTKQGYDQGLIKSVISSVDVPVIACGGASSLGDLFDALNLGASAAAAGAMFVFQGRHNAVLISYPSPSEIESLSSKY